jgi:hypothetical protein
MPRAVGASARRRWKAVTGFFYKIYVSEYFTRPVVEHGGQAVIPPFREETHLMVAWHYVRWLANGTIPLFATLGKYFIISLRAVYVFFFYLTQHIEWTGRDRVRQWTIFDDLTNVHWDWPYFFSVLRHPSLGLRDYRRWRKRKGLRFARPKIRFVEFEFRDPEENWAMEDRNWDTANRRGGPFLGQDNPFDYVSDDEGGWEGDRKGKGKATEEEVVGETEHREMGDETGYAPGVEMAEQADEPAQGVSIGRKEAKRGAKKRKGKGKH